MNSFEFKPPKDRQTDTGDSGEAPQHFPIENIFSQWSVFFLLQTATHRQTYSSNRHRTHRHWILYLKLWTVIVQTATYRQTETAFYNIDYENVRKIRSIGYCKRSICPEITFKTLSELLAKKLLPVPSKMQVIRGFRVNSSNSMIFQNLDPEFRINDKKISRLSLSWLLFCCAL